MKKPLRKIPTPQNLTNVALHYLQRFAASEASLRRVLINRIRRAAMDHPDFAQDDAKKKILHSAIETIIESHKKTGALNDAAYAEIKVNSLRRQGRSRRMIEQKLAVKGIKGVLVADALRQHADDRDAEDVEYQTALALARKRKWGTFRTKAADADRIRKEFAALARAGFSSSIARRVLDYVNDDLYDDV